MNKKQKRRIKLRNPFVTITPAVKREKDEKKEQSKRLARKAVEVST